MPESSTDWSRRRWIGSVLATGWGSSWLGQRIHGQERVGVPTIEQRIDDLAANAPLKMRYQGTSADECRAWQRQFGAKLRELLGPIEPPAKWKTHVERVVDLEDHQRKELVLEAEGLAPVPMHVLVPKKSSGKLAGILALHGHGRFGHDPVAGIDDTAELRQAIESANYDYGRQLVRQGYAVAVPCLTPFGRRRGGPGDSDICGVTATRLQFLGRSLIGENLRDARWALNALLQQTPVDPGRLGCVGLSYGGRMTTLVAAVDERIQVAVVSGALNCFQERVYGAYGAGCQLIPGILEHGDIPEIASLIAPRSLLWEVGNSDRLIDPVWVERAWQRMQSAYQSFGQSDRLQIDRFNGGHRWNGQIAQKILRDILSP
ncbi:MAG: hypothetical protein JNM18_03290 [Planctomycetaceae bacterium]|nr:hypothetical protein [Planctomycetaceae bacterium]